METGAWAGYIRGMGKKPKRPRDLNQLAKFIIDEATDNAPKDETLEKPLSPAERGKLGGQKGGKSRAETLTQEQRSAAAKKAAASRWAR